MPSKRSFLLVAPPLISVLCCLAIWKIAASRIGADIILPPPERVLSSFLSLVVTPRFLRSAGATGLRCLAAFSASLAAGIVLGLPAGVSRTFRSAILPFMAVIRSTPVLAVIVLFLIWFPQDAIPAVSAILMAAPVAVSAFSEGVRSIDPQLLEMAAVHRVPPVLRLFRIYLPSLSPHAVAGASSSLSLVWKVVVAGEVLSQPRFAIGTGLQNAKIQLETSTALAWTLATVILCALADSLFSLFARRLRHEA